MAARARSFWAWGWEDKLPDEKARRELADLVAGVLGLDRPLPLLDLPSEADARLPAPRIEAPAALSELASADRAERLRHTYGKGYPDIVRGFHGDFAPAPDLVALPRSEDEVAAVLAWASRERVAVVPFGGGTSVVGGVEHGGGPRWRGVVSLDLRRMDRLLDVDEVSLAARIQGGATGPRFEEQLAARGLTFRHYPQSYEFSTVGGWIATRSSGHFATLWTHVDDFVESVRMVTPTGVYETRRLPASGAGPDPNRLVLGSEGILGVVTEAWIRVQRRPRHRAKATVRFDDFDAAVEAAREIAQSRLHPANCRLLDAHEAMMNRVAFANVLLLAFESTDHPQDASLDRAVAIATAHGGEVEARSDHDADGDGGERWRRAFLDAPYLQSALVSLGVLADTFETAITWERFGKLHAAVKAAVEATLARECGGGIVSCRFTHVYPDGPAPYYTFVAPAEPGREIAQWRAVKEAASDALAAHGATITHHHAVGRVHRPWYAREVPQRFLGALRGAKRELDPAGVLNPGVLLDELSE